MAAAPSSVLSDSNASVVRTLVCVCEEVEVECTFARVVFNIICHCKACSRMRSSSTGVHLVALPKENVVVSKGESLLREGRVKGNRMTQHFCTSCGTGLWQNPQDASFRVVFPVNFRLGDPDSPSAVLPDDLLPTMHTNYENRLIDTTTEDVLPKRRVFGSSELLHSDGTLVEADAGGTP
jgi:hypothetical protein